MHKALLRWHLRAACALSLIVACCLAGVARQRVYRRGQLLHRSMICPA
jgi:hypothetical protein